MDIDAFTKAVMVKDLSFPVVDYGDGPAVLLLHGFPDSRWLWRYQIPALAEAGFRVIAPDLRGFGEAPKPAAVEAYKLAVIMADLLGILNALKINQTSVAGHDWGAAVAWGLTAYFPDRVTRLAAMSVGCPGTSGLWTIQQRERSWYYCFFQFEGVAEEWLRFNDWQLFREWTRGDGDMARYLSDLSRPGALTAALNWYRANLKPKPPAESGSAHFPVIQRPVLGVWSDGDHYLNEVNLLNSQEKISGSWRYEKITGASHWMMLDKPQEINRLLVDFLVVEQASRLI